MKKIGILGGTFNPVHLGHIYLAKSFYNALNLDKVLIIPDATPPHKTLSAGASDEDRMKMLSLAIKDFPFMELSDWEIKQGGKSYTYFTLNHFKKDGTKLYFLTGSDMFLSLESWYNYPEIMTLATFCAVARNEEDKLLLLKKQEFFKEQGYKTEILDIAPLEISSSEIREKTRKNEKISTFLPSAVAEYIAERKLYV